MFKLKVFYHVFIPDDMRACAWTWHIDQQLQLIKKSKLDQIAQVLLYVTMPAGWINLFGSDFFQNSTHNIVTFAVKLQEYINARYPWAIIANIRDTGEPNIFEGTTLNGLHQHSLSEDFFALYIHTKGVVPQSSPSVANWREILNHYMIEQWPQNVALLQHNQVVAVDDQHTQPHAIVSGNFFWTRSDYVRTLQDPIQAYVHSDQFHRYSFEAWILSKNPKVHYVINTGVDHYGTYCFLENLTAHKQKAE